MNKFRKSEQLSSLLAFVLSGLFYVTTVVLIFFMEQRAKVDPQPAMGPKAVNLSFAQIELQAAAASLSAPAPAAPIPQPPEPANVALKEIQKDPEPEAPRSEAFREAPVPVASQVAQVAQSASASGAQIEAAESLSGHGRIGEISWRAKAIAKLSAMVEREKYYPPAAQKAGYTGRISVRICLEPDGTIDSYEITERRGHPLLVRGVETTLGKIQGRNIGMNLPERFEFIQPIEFELR